MDSRVPDCQHPPAFDFTDNNYNLNCQSSQYSNYSNVQSPISPEGTPFSQQYFHETDEVYSRRYGEELISHPTVNNPAYQQSADFPLESQLFSHQTSTSEIETADIIIERHIQDFESQTSSNSQYSSETEASEIKQESNETDVKEFQIKRMSNRYEEFTNVYRFTSVRNTERNWYLCINMAEYDNLRGEDLKTFNQQRIKYFQLELKEGKCPLVEQRLNYQKRKSKRKNKNIWLSCRKGYNTLKKQLNKEEFEMLKRHAMLHYKYLKLVGGQQ